MIEARQKKKPVWKHLLWIAIVLCIGFFCLTQGYQFFLRQAYPIKYSDIVKEESERYGLDEMLVYSIIKAESNFDPSAHSHAGAVGLMQLTPQTFEWIHTKLQEDREYTEKDMEDPEINIRYGCKLLSMLLSMYPCEATALSAYNAGIGTVSGWLSDPQISPDGETLLEIPYPETEQYVERVFNNLEIYKKLYS